MPSSCLTSCTLQIETVRRKLEERFNVPLTNFWRTLGADPFAQEAIPLKCVNAKCSLGAPIFPCTYTFSLESTVVNILPRRAFSPCKNLSANFKVAISLFYINNEFSFGLTEGCLLKGSLSFLIFNLSVKLNFEVLPLGNIISSHRSLLAFRSTVGCHWNEK